MNARFTARLAPAVAILATTAALAGSTGASANPTTSVVASAAEMAATPQVSPSIPRSFPLAAGLDGGGDNVLTGPQNRGPGVGLIADCGELIWPPADAVRRRAVQVSGPEYAEARELYTFRSADKAVAAIATARASMRACDRIVRDESFHKRVITLRRVSTGYDSVTWSNTAPRNVLGGDVTQLVRVGSSVLGTYRYGETTTRDSLASARQLTKDNKVVTSRMCRWSVAGC